VEKLSRAKQLLLYAAPFPPLVFFKIWTAGGPPPEMLLWGASAMFAYGALILVIASYWDSPSYFDWAVTAYFALISAGLLIWPHVAGPAIIRYGITGIYGVLFSAAFFPPLLGLAPFTYHYAKRITPEMFWTNPVFVRINRIMTSVWSAIFALCIILSLYPTVLTRLIVPIALILGFGLPFNLRFPGLYLKRLGLPSLANLGELLRTKETFAEAADGERKEGLPAESQSFREAQETYPGERRAADRVIFEKRKEESMYVLALNSSPRTGNHSKTERMLDHLVSGMREAGARVEVVELRKKLVKPCMGCFSCWTKTPGKCIHLDDMTQELFPKWLEADLVVYAFPLYHFTMNAVLKNFIERTLPVVQPFFLRKEGRTGHPLRQNVPKAVVLSVAGFPEMSVFEQLSSWVRFLFGHGGRLVAEIYRPAAEMMTYPAFREKADEIFRATEQAGREIVTSMKIEPETLARITQDITANWDTLSEIANLMWKTCIKEGLSPREFAEKGGIPRPDSIKTFLLIMSLGFKPAAGRDLKATLQFNFSGENEGACHFRIDQGKIEGFEGPAEKADLIIDTPFELWMDIMTGKKDGQQAFLEKGYKVRGDFALLLKMRELFGR
jgi:multimeric flavodoxin WrbA